MKRTRQLIYCASLIALALVLSYMERLIPLQMFLGLPGIKLGLANVVTLMALYFFGCKTALIILGIRCFLGASFGGGFSSLAFSLIGGIVALLVMTVGSRMKLFSIYGVSILGAAAHQIGQIGVATVLMGSRYVIGYLPYLLIVSIFTGMATGSVCNGVFRILAVSGQVPQNSWKA